jgi:hypothetical protein
MGGEEERVRHRGRSKAGVSQSDVAERYRGWHMWVRRECGTVNKAGQGVSQATEWRGAAVGRRVCGQAWQQEA